MGSEGLVHVWEYFYPAISGLQSDEPGAFSANAGIHELTSQ